MPILTLAFFGDIVGSPGRRAFAHGAQIVREKHGAQVVIVNAENAKHGSGLSHEGYNAIRRAGADALTLGDHVYREREALPLLETPDAPVCRPANLALGAPGKRAVRIPPAAPGLPPVYAIIVLGRLHMPMPADDPFAAIDRELAAIPENDAVAVVEIHAEFTSEKQAVAWHCARNWHGRVAAVVGTHTHTQTSDARILEHSVGAITDVGMCGPRRSILGRRVDDVLRMMTTQAPTVLDVADEEPRACGVIVRFDLNSRRALSIEPLDLAAPS
ncbi:MAG: YmdB family metallophosphoesterase [Phycisphaerales bacterium]|nr:YmdB family metallophosphoesterase [Phycisphaerales bacterium]